MALAAVWGTFLCNSSFFASLTTWVLKTSLDVVKNLEFFDISRDVAFKNDQSLEFHNALKGLGLYNNQKS